MSAGEPVLPIEVTLNDEALSGNWSAFMNFLPCRLGVQLVKKNNVYRVIDRGGHRVIIMSADLFLRHLI